jgi:hypothetical protein
VWQPRGTPRYGAGAPHGSHAIDGRSTRVRCCRCSAATHDSMMETPTLRRLAQLAGALAPTMRAVSRGGVNDNYLDNFDRDALRDDQSPSRRRNKLALSRSSQWIDGRRTYDRLNYTEAEIFQPDGHCDYYGSKGFLSASVDMRRHLLRIPTAELAPATVPEVCRSRRGTPPALWSVQDWQRLVERQQHEPLFDMDAVRAQYAAQSFRDDGYCVFRGIMTEETRRQWTQAMIDLHALNDQMISSDWRSAVDWRTLRVRPPLSVHTPEQKAAALGGAQRLTPMNDDNGGFAMRLHGVLPEYFPPAHIGYLMFVLFHPQLLDLHRLVLESDEVYYATAQSNCKRPGDPGARWHSHGGMPSFNDCRLRTPAEYIAEGCMNLMLVYPAGFPRVQDGGQLSIIRGAHLYCDTAAESPAALSGAGSAVNDAAMEGGWMKAKLHPVTGTPLRVERLDLPPVSQTRRVRVKIMGSLKCGIVGKSQPVLIMINPIIFTCTRSVIETPWSPFTSGCRRFGPPTAPQSHD